MEQNDKPLWVSIIALKRLLRTCEIDKDLSMYQMIETRVLEGICAELLEYKLEHLHREVADVIQENNSQTG